MRGEWITWGGLATILVMGVTHLSNPASAAPLTAMDATALLSQSRAIDLKCQVLSGAERDELMDFLARAEIALAEKMSVKVARGAIARGKKLASSTTCKTEDTSLVRNTLAAARAAVGTPATVQPVAPATPIVQPEPAQQDAGNGTSATIDRTKPMVDADASPAQQVEPADRSTPATQALAIATPAKTSPVKLRKVQAVLAKAAPVKPAPSKIKTTPKGGNLDSYASVAQRYFVELRCRSMNSSKLKALYANVLSQHRAAVAENNPSAVKAMLRKAEARASGTRCS